MIESFLSFVFLKRIKCVIIYYIFFFFFFLNVNSSSYFAFASLTESSIVLPNIYVFYLLELVRIPITLFCRDNDISFMGKSYALNNQSFFVSSWKKASIGNVGSSVVILKFDETTLVSGDTALNIPGLS